MIGDHHVLEEVTELLERKARQFEHHRAVCRHSCQPCQCLRPCCLCVPFLRPRRCTRSHRTGLCQHAFPKGETSVRSPSHTGHTLPQPLRAAEPGSRATCSPPVCFGTKAASARCALPRRLFKQRGAPSPRDTQVPKPRSHERQRTLETP